MTPANTQILTAFEEEGLMPQQIADALDYDIVAVKATLMQFSSKYRQSIKAEGEDSPLDFTYNEQKEARDAMVRIMRSSEDEYLVARLASKIRDDGKGRLDNGMMKGLNINVTLINDRILKARDLKNRLLGNAQPIDV